MLKFKRKNALRNKTQPCLYLVGLYIFKCFAYNTGRQLEEPARTIPLYLQVNPPLAGILLSHISVMVRIWRAVLLGQEPGVWHCGLFPHQTTRHRSLLRASPTSMSPKPWGHFSISHLLAQRPVQLGHLTLKSSGKLGPPVCLHQTPYVTAVIYFLLRQRCGALPKSHMAL